MVSPIDPHTTSSVTENPVVPTSLPRAKRQRRRRRRGAQSRTSAAGKTASDEREEEDGVPFDREMDLGNEQAEVEGHENVQEKEKLEVNPSIHLKTN
jgi:hypothetical protein